MVLKDVHSFPHLKKIVGVGVMISTLCIVSLESGDAILGMSWNGTAIPWQEPQYQI